MMRWTWRIVVVAVMLFALQNVLVAQQEQKPADPGIVVDKISFDSIVEQYGVTFWATPNSTEYQYTPRLIIHPQIYLSREENELAFWVSYDATVLEQQVSIQGQPDQRRNLKEYILDKVKRTSGVDLPQFALATQLAFELRITNQEGSWNFRQKELRRFGELDPRRYARVSFVYDGPRLTAETLPPLFADRYIQFSVHIFVGGKRESHVGGRVRFHVKQEFQEIERTSNTRVFFLSESKTEQSIDMKTCIEQDIRGWSGYNATPQHEALLASFTERAIAACFTNASYGSIPSNAFIRTSEGYFRKSDLDAARDALTLVMNASTKSDDEERVEDTSREKTQETSETQNTTSQETVNDESRERRIEGGGEVGLGSGKRRMTADPSPGWSGKIGALLDKIPSVDLRVRGSASGGSRHADRRRLEEDAKQAESRGDSVEDFLTQSVQVGLENAFGGNVVLNALQAINIHHSTFKRTVSQTFEQTVDFSLSGYGSSVEGQHVMRLESPNPEAVVFVFDGRPPAMQGDTAPVAQGPEFWVEVCDACNGHPVQTRTENYSNTETCDDHNPTERYHRFNIESGDMGLPYRTDPCRKCGRIPRTIQRTGTREVTDTCQACHGKGKIQWVRPPGGEKQKVPW